MEHYDRILTVIVSSLVSAAIILLVINIGKEKCEQDSPRTQQCELKWVKPESAKK